jgi:pimeloyl-ACP methyl ester carboxylesterase
VLINRALERVRQLRLADVLLRRRGRAQSHLPLIVVPGMFGTRLADARGRLVWGSTARLYRGPSIAAAEGARSDGLIEEMSLLPGLAGVDVHGGLLRFLERAGGYRRGEDLIALDYDWRAGALAGAEALAALVQRVRGASDDKVDLCCVSTGGQVARHFLAREPRAVRRVLYVGAPQRGTFDALASLHRGFRFAPGGKLFRGAEAARTQTALDALPHPDEPLFVDDRGARVPLDLYDERTWRETGLLEEAVPELQDGLDRARAAHRALDVAPAGDAFVIGARHLPTPARVVLLRGKAHVPPPAPRRDDPFVGFTYLPGDGELSEASLRAVPGLDEKRLWWATPAAHARLPADPLVHRYVLEGLLATERFIPATILRSH